MSLIKREPQRELSFFRTPFSNESLMQSMQRDMNRLFDHFFRGDIVDDGSFASTDWSPLIDVIERGDAYILKAELPGMKKEEITISLENNVMTLRGEKKMEDEKKAEGYHRVERRFGRFERSFTLPSLIKTESIDAKFENGVLTVVLPKTEETKAKTIGIKISD